MRWKVLKYIRIKEVQKRIEALEDKYGSLSYLHAEFSKGRMPPGQFDDYIEWNTMDHALRAYQEGEDFEYMAEEELEFSSEEYGKLTPRRMELLDHLTRSMAGSINELADQLGRDVKNVYEDLQILENLDFISLSKEGRRTIPTPIVYEITLTFG